MTATEKSDLSLFLRRRGDGTVGMDFAVEGVHCGGCIGRIERALAGIPGVTEARLNFTNRRLSASWKIGAVTPDVIVAALDKLGYRAHPFAPRQAEDEEAAHAKWLLRCLAVAGFAAMNIMLLSVSVWSGNVTDITPETRDLFHWLSALIALPAAAYAGQPFFSSAFKALKARAVNMDVPISLGVVLALGMSLVETWNHAQHAYFDSAVMLLFFLLCGRYLEHAMRRKTRAVAGNLAALKAETAHRLFDNGELVQVPAEALRVGDRVLVRPGDRIPADAAVVGGKSDIDESLITGETAPRSVASGANVYAGSINLGGTLTLRVTAAGQNTLIDDIDRLLDKAVKSRSRYVRLADRAARYYAPVVHTAAALTLAGWLIAGASLHDAIIVAISVLIITCPCALALAIPAVQVATAGRLFRHGVFLNSGDAIERLAETDTIVFDKTGTLTLPEPRVVNAASIDPALLRAAARLALSSRHPLAAAVARQAETREPIEGAVEEPGQGVRARVGGVEMRLGSPAFCGVAVDPAFAAAEQLGASTIAFRHGERQAVFIVHQSLRPGAASVIHELHAMGLDLHILSGDRPGAVGQIAQACGIRSWQAGLKPDEKVKALDAFRLAGRKVLMVGDGINDAPSLAAASVSMSPISAADLAQAQADAVFLGEQLTPVLEAVVTARRARRLMRQNLGLAVIYNATAVPVAVAGLVTPLIAAAAMSSSSILVSLNALRMRYGSPPRHVAADQAAAPAATEIARAA
jgi:Cu2+-exporting ATPase